MATQSMVDVPSLLMVVSFTSNVILGFFDPLELPVFQELGVFLLVGGSLCFTYVLFYLRRGFFGETEPNLAFRQVEGPYRLCRHPQYLSFIVMVVGIDLMLSSVIGLLCSLVLSIPSAVYRAKVEDKLLRDKFGEGWDDYAQDVGFLIPKFKK